MKRLAIILLCLLIPVLVLGAALSYPLQAPPYLPSIQSGAKQIDQTHLAALQYYRARDGVNLAYRLYPAQVPSAGDDKAREQRSVAILIHGSSGSGRSMTTVAQTLAAAGVNAVAADMRGHGASGEHGDIAYVGQLEDDLQDLLVHLRATSGPAKPVLLGHSSGGGFALRIAGGPLGDAFARYILLAPYLGYDAPTSRTSAGWAKADIPRMMALAILNSMGVRAFDGLPVLAFAIAPGTQANLTPAYSWRLMRNFAVPMDSNGGSEFRQSFASASRPVSILSGTEDALINATHFSEVAAKSKIPVSITILPGTDHMSILYEPAALTAITAAVKQ